MTRPGPTAAVWVVAAGLAVAIGVARAAPGGGHGGGNGGGGGGVGHGSPPPKALVIAGEVEGLYPGGAATLPLRITNPHSFAVTVTSLVIEVLQPEANCPAGALVVDQPPLGTVVPRDAATTVDVTVRMLATAPDGCQGATFPLRYTVSAIKAR